LNLLTEIPAILFIIVGSCYAIIIIAFNVAWFRLKWWKNTITSPVTKVTVIIPVRNEEKNIIPCLEKVTTQNYPSSLYEIIVVNDSSTDHTFSLVTKFMLANSHKSISLLNLSQRKTSFKKAAITRAVNITQSDLIITTDADCSMSEGWITAIAGYYEKMKPAMIAGPVCFKNEKGIFNKMQALEFLSLIASGAASIQLGMPTMCNGANLAYERSAFLQAGGYDDDLNYTSGDDIFLLHKMKAQHKKIAFIKSREAIVETTAQPSLKMFLNQRKRWVSKSRGYTNIATITVALLVLLFNSVIVASLIMSFFFTPFLWLFLEFFIIKSVVDLPVLTGISTFANKKKLMYFYLPLQIIYPLYIVCTGFLGLFGSFEWKERKYKQ